MSNTKGLKFHQIIEDVDQDSRPVYEPDSITEWVLKKKTMQAIHRLYHDLDLTVRDICHLYGFEYKSEYQKLFYKIFGPKGKSHGGSRRAKSKF